MSDLLLYPKRWKQTHLACHSQALLNRLVSGSARVNQPSALSSYDNARGRTVIEQTERVFHIRFFS